MRAFSAWLPTRVPGNANNLPSDTIRNVDGSKLEVREDRPPHGNSSSGCCRLRDGRWTAIGRPCFAVRLRDDRELCQGGDEEPEAWGRQRGDKEPRHFGFGVHVSPTKKEGPSSRTTRPRRVASHRSRLATRPDIK